MRPTHRSGRAFAKSRRRRAEGAGPRRADLVRITRPSRRGPDGRARRGVVHHLGRSSRQARWTPGFLGGSRGLAGHRSRAAAVVAGSRRAPGPGTSVHGHGRHLDSTNAECHCLDGSPADLAGAARIASRRSDLFREAYEGGARLVFYHVDRTAGQPGSTSPCTRHDGLCDRRPWWPDEYCGDSSGSSSSPWRTIS